MFKDKIAATNLKLFKLKAYTIGINKISSLKALPKPWIVSCKYVYSNWYVIKVLFSLTLNTAVSTKICVILYEILNTILYIIKISKELVKIIGIVTTNIASADIKKALLFPFSFKH